MSFCCPNLISRTLGWMTCAFLLTAVIARAQTQNNLPSALVPHALLVLPLTGGTTGTTNATQPANPAGRESGGGPLLTIAPHPENARYWVSGQANSIFQMHGHFRSPYEGPNSLIDDFETKASEVTTLYLGYQLFPNTRYNTDLIVDVENAGGRGISQSLGLAGETNLDVVRNPSLSIKPYLSRGRDSSDFRLDQRDDRPGSRASGAGDESAGAPV